MGVTRMKTSTMQLLFWAFAVVMGLSLSTIFLVYSGGSIAGAFFATAAGFAALSLYGYTTKRDLSAFGTFLTIGLVGLIVASLITCSCSRARWPWSSASSACCCSLA